MYSRKKIKEAGKVLMGNSNKMTKSQAHRILGFFRVIHIHAMMNFRILLERKIKKLGLKKRALLSQRLKRVPSILQKLKLMPEMSLARMQDVGGLRVVVKNIDDLYSLKESIRESEKSSAFKSRFIKEDDYIKNPKPSGYRSLHLVYRYEKNVIKNRSCLVEIQLRTELHHAWATAVEVVGTYLKQPLKQSLGEDKYLSLFKKISEAFILIEKDQQDLTLFSKVKNEVEETKLIEILRGFSIATKHAEGNSGKYFLIRLDFKEKTLNISQFKKTQLEVANNLYTQLEAEYFDNKNVEIVLVSVDDITKLKTLYPNYFLDTAQFLKYLEKVLSAKSSKGV